MSQTPQLHVLGALALELTGAAPVARDALAQPEVGALAALVARDLAKFAPEAAQLELVTVGAHYDPVELLRPGWPLHRELDQLAARAPRAGVARDEGRVIAFGAHDERLPGALAPSPDYAGGPLRLLPFVLFAWAQQSITAGLGSILNAMTPVWGVIVAHLFTRDERMTPAKVAGVPEVVLVTSPQPDGTAVLPLGRDPWNPNSAVAPGASERVARAVTACPLVVTAAFHDPVIECPDGRVNATLHVIVDVPVLVTRTGWTTYPVPHWVWVVATTVQPDPPPATVTATADDTGDVLPAASRAYTANV